MNSLISKIENDELHPEFTNVNGFKLDNNKLIFTGEYCGQSLTRNNLVPLTLKSSDVKYVLESITFNFDKPGAESTVYIAKPVGVV